MPACQALMEIDLATRADERGAGGGNGGRGRERIMGHLGLAVQIFGRYFGCTSPVIVQRIPPGPQAPV